MGIEMYLEKFIKIRFWNFCSWNKTSSLVIQLLRHLHLHRVGGGNNKRNLRYASTKTRRLSPHRRLIRQPSSRRKHRPSVLSDTSAGTRSFFLFFFFFWSIFHQRLVRRILCCPQQLRHRRSVVLSSQSGTSQSGFTLGEVQKHSKNGSGVASKAAVGWENNH